MPVRSRVKQRIFDKKGSRKKNLWRNFANEETCVGRGKKKREREEKKKNEMEQLRRRSDVIRENRAEESDEERNFLIWRSWSGIRRMEEQEGCRRSKNENALPRRLLSEFSRRSTLVVRWIAPASGSGRYYERSRGEKERLAEKNEEEGRLLSSLSAGIPKQRARDAVHRWTICKSVAGRGHDVATSSSRYETTFLNLRHRR